MDDKDLTQGAYVKPPSGSYTSWENTMCNPLGDMRTQTQSAWADGYASAKAEWVGLTNEEFAEILCDKKWQYRPELMILEAQAKLKEKNHG